MWNIDWNLHLWYKSFVAFFCLCNINQIYKVFKLLIRLNNKIDQVTLGLKL